nr:unnamed protein product [Callosobruchus analis]CAI5867925.1 unnamed protein product [Callosobruchus analis]
MFLQGLIICKEIKRRRPRKENANMRSNSFSYHILVGNTRKEICMNAFCGLHAGSTTIDKRGKQRNSNAMKASEIILVNEHISTFPTKQTHYSTREYNYLDADLHIKIMHSLFLQMHPQYKITYEYYNKIFRQNFNLSFGRPQVDVCNECETISLKLRNKALNDTAKRVATAELLVHKRRAKKFYNTLKSSQETCHSRMSLQYPLITCKICSCLDPPFKTCFI